MYKKIGPLGNNGLCITIGLILIYSELIPHKEKSIQRIFTKWYPNPTEEYM